MSDWNTEIAEWYAEKNGNYPTNFLGVDQVELEDDAIIIYIGCGTGSALRYAAKKIPHGQLIGKDPVPRMVEIAKEQTENHEARDRIDFRIGSAEKIPADDRIAQYVLAFDSIDHWQDIDQGLGEVKRILQTSGLFAIIKDNGTPGAKQAIQFLIGKLTSAGFKIKESKEISQNEVSFYFLICAIAE